MKIRYEFEDEFAKHVYDGKLASAYRGDAAVDLRVTAFLKNEFGDIPESMRHERMLLHNGITLFGSFGVKVAIPEGHFGIIAMRSSTFKSYGLMLTNSVGIIDSGYRGVLGFSVVHVSNHTWTELPVGARIAQLVIVPHVTCEYINGSVGEHETDRGSGGFGSSGVN